MTSAVLHDIVFELPHIRLAGLTNGNVGKPLLLGLHGWLDNANSFVPMAPCLNDFHFIAIDWPGHGLSQHRPAGTEYNQLDYIDDLHQLIVSQGWRDVSIVGHSMGGILGSIYAAVFPEYVKALVSIDAYGPIFSDHTVETIRDGILSRHQRREKPQQQTPIVFSRLVKQRAAHSDLDNENVTLLLSRAVEWHSQEQSILHRLSVWRNDKRLRNQSLLRLTETQVRALMAAVECPVLIVKAANGLVAKHATDKQRSGWFSNARIVEVEGGHHCHMQYPASICSQIGQFVSLNE
ncbi:alpha/beta fold hydrolase [Alteromonas facilis]|uniref:alpha/beta fold hydrolase n=1 Tax=Alteromonas facilis TaxID=2048004 RepID=UPI000C284F3E|nr:alpha/beta hydrolase [Alteromonas facilis]